MEDWILHEVDGGIATITINRPEKKNAMSYKMLADFVAAIKKAGNDDSTRVVILTGTPGSFCAGTDLSDLASVPGESRASTTSTADTSNWWPIIACPKPVIAAVDGPAVGMGAEFTSQCDIRLASTRARFAWNFSQRGLVPDTGAGSWLLPRLIGTSQAFWLLYSGEFISAREAHDLKFVSGVFEPDELLGQAREMAETILQASPFSQQRIKTLVYEGLGIPVEQHMANHAVALAECFRSDDHKEGVASFLERRPAKFTGH
ncbi:MAG TPA: enoyl-CoA hydratase-related protein [Pseudomonadales bacterium]|jgi:enoyl-CoA hydratase|nr:enoyl-CoA hydratase [Gammaproteobacteria bacterium]MDP6024375.1 enoyl-CoA hydratase-related protein [Pseudomonadales bacterium]MDP6316572.1 enoyl-CoA hydratase-related protein [Pseudomonadales bacterium]MDP7315205.1 enoyl-CoA hydratase-related protein [Pseudomonadales bacterium]HJP51379.1 enoyl-CoA hydratase-related protein [Pseudomonadales bacterium]|tara:strand:+ start:20009 stop:20791 length:783 start_codon:yes stop_codon:yes gene_type:complete